METLSKIAGAILILCVSAALLVAAIAWAIRPPAATVPLPYENTPVNVSYCHHCRRYVNPLSVCPYCRESLGSRVPSIPETMPVPNVRPGSQTGSSKGEAAKPGEK